MFIPTGIPEEPNAKTYKLVKSGFLKTYTSKCLPQGNNFKVSWALSTNFTRISDYSLFTTATNPSNSALILSGSR